VELEALAAKDRAFKLGEVFEASGLTLAKKLTTDGKLYALPRGGGLLHIFYNRDAFAQQGLKDPNELYDAKQWTWAAAVDAATKLTRRNGVTTERYGHAADFTIQRAIAVVAANGGQVFDEGRKRFVFADDTASVDAVQWLVDLKDKHAVAQPVPPPDGEPTSAQTLFATGKAAMFHGLATYLAAMTPVIGTTFRYAVAPMPVGKKEATFGNAAGGMGVFKAGKRTDLGWALAKYFAGADAYVTSIKHNYVQLPMLNDKRAKEAFLASGVYGIDRVLKHAATSVTESFAATNLGDIRNVFDREATAIWRGAAPVRTALTAAQREMQALFDANAGK
jgi:multiple sugar transport system substrate-binding protein